MMAKGQIKQKQDNISKVLFENLCGIQCTKEEMCSVLNVSEKTLNSWCNAVYNKNFSLVFSEKRECGKSSLRRTQFKLAERNAAMAIWLGKQYLGQRDIIENQITELTKVEELLSKINKEAKDDIK